MRQCVSFSGGKDSTAMLLMMLERGEDVSEVVYLDTGWEFPAMTDHINKLELEIGLTITRLQPPVSFDWAFSEKPVVSAVRGNHNGYGWCHQRCRWCTGYKKDTIAKYLRTKKYDYTCIGIAVGEERRIKDDPKVRYPLIEYKTTEIEALHYCIRRGYDWNGLYDVFDRVSCYCCPLQSRANLLNLKRFYPELFNRMRELDSRLQYSCLFKDGLTFSEYEKYRIDDYVPLAQVKKEVKNASEH